MDRYKNLFELENRYYGLINNPFAILAVIIIVIAFAAIIFNLKTPKSINSFNNGIKRIGYFIIFLPVVFLIITLIFIMK